MSKAKAEVKEELRKFLCVRTDKTVVMLSVRVPDDNEIEQADMEYSAIFNRGLLSRLPTQASLLRRLRENNVIDEKDENEIGQLTAETQVLSKRLRDNKYADDAAKHQDEELIRIKQDRLGQLTSEMDAMFEHTCDAKAGLAQRNFLIACVVEYVDGPKNGERVWNSIEDLQKETDRDLLNRVMYEYLMMTNGRPSNWDEIMKAQTLPTETKTDEEQAGESAIAQAVDATPVIDIEDSTPATTDTQPEVETEPEIESPDAVPTP